MKRISLIFAWWIAATYTLVVGAMSFMFFVAKPHIAVVNPSNQTANLAAANTLETPNLGEVKGIQTIVESADARSQIVANFLRRYKSPLQPYDEYGKKLVEIADRYDIDFRLLPAIAMQESNLCKKIPEGSFNCLGFGIHERGTLEFESFEANFDRAAKELKMYYIDKGRTTPEEIMRKYTPGSNGSWAESVNQWMAEMRYDDHARGKEMKTDANVLEFTSASSSAKSDL